MDYERYFTDRLGNLKDEGNYRVFADLEREVGAFPKAKRHVGEGQNAGTHDVTV